jgi:hypothetical protein
MLYMVTFTNQYTPNVSIYTSTMDPMGLDSSGVPCDDDDVDSWILAGLTPNLRQV